MTKYSLSIGLNDKDTKQQKIGTVEAYKIVENIIVEKIGGGSIFEGRGVYKHEDGQAVIEKSLLVEIYKASEKQVLEVAKAIKIALNQESIILSTKKRGGDRK